ncbi:MAG TPA: hypothetical protein VHB98_21390, partial [Chloroflexota bacterium]|nr:hypothetical protein [Chloroflexota bacterium]
MNVADGLKRLKRSGPELMNGKSEPTDQAAVAAAPMPGALMAALPMVALAGVAVIALRRRTGERGTVIEH